LPFIAASHPRDHFHNRFLLRSGPTQNSPNPFNISEQCQPLPDVKYTVACKPGFTFTAGTTALLHHSGHGFLTHVYIWSSSAYHFKDAVLKLYYFMPQPFCLGKILGTIQSYSGLDLFKVLRCLDIEMYIVLLSKQSTVSTSI
jgi:hypothetical protein